MRPPPPQVVLLTSRLRLRDWGEQDRQPFANLNADPEVMEHFPGLLERRTSDALVDRIEAQFRSEGWGLWAVELIESHDFTGFVGLSPVPPTAPFGPALEVGWRLARSYWGCGYATEAARAALAFAFDALGVEEVVSFTSTANLRSQRVMQRLGMASDPKDDFDHWNLPQGHPLGRQVLYRLRREDHDRARASWGRLAELTR
ncbi:MAG: GNAT family N-acetyltransferase [Candidatus Dormibacteria bacterium]